MINTSQQTKRIFLVILVILGWFAVVLQFYLILLNRTASITETIARFFGFFTILTNILVALCCTFLLVAPGSKPGIFFSRTSTLTAITVYIAVVGIIYNVILRFQWSPQGLQRLVDELLHSVNPVLFILFWFLFVPKQTLKWKYVWPWMIYPFVYCVYTLFRGAASGFYPYPFIDVSVLGYSTVFRNIAGMILVFLVISLVLIGIGKITGKDTRTGASL